jgi:hypothetical protein
MGKQAMGQVNLLQRVQPPPLREVQHDVRER